MKKVTEIDVKEEMEKVGFRFEEDIFYYSPELMAVELPSKKDMILSLRQICAYFKSTAKEQYVIIDKFIEEIYFLMGHSITEKFTEEEFSLYLLILMDKIHLMWINIGGEIYKHFKRY